MFICKVQALQMYTGYYVLKSVESFTWGMYMSLNNIFYIFGFLHDWHFVAGNLTIYKTKCNEHVLDLCNSAWIFFYSKAVTTYVWENQSQKYIKLKLCTEIFQSVTMYLIWYQYEVRRN
jgi:hypothetical protein